MSINLSGAFPIERYILKSVVYCIGRSMRTLLQEKYILSGWGV